MGEKSERINKIFKKKIKTGKDQKYFKYLKKQ